MRVKDLIKELEKMPQEANVNLFDWRKNLSDDIGDGSSEGVYSRFDIHYEELSEDEMEYYKDVNDREYIPWVAISFENDDYNDEGVCLLTDN